MKKIVLASRNKKKIFELQTILQRELGNVEVLSLDDIGYFDDIPENGETFEENAITKASVPAKLGYIGIAAICNGIVRCSHDADYLIFPINIFPL